MGCCHIYHWIGLYSHHQPRSLYIGNNSKAVPFTFHQFCGIYSGSHSSLINHRHGWLSPFPTSHTLCHHHSHRIQQLEPNHSSLMLHMPVHRTSLPQLSPSLLSLLQMNHSQPPKLQMFRTSLLPLWAAWSLPNPLPPGHVPKLWPLHECHLGPLPL